MPASQGGRPHDTQVDRQQQHDSSGGGASMGGQRPLESDPGRDGQIIGVQTHEGLAASMHIAQTQARQLRHIELCNSINSQIHTAKSAKTFPSVWSRLKINPWTEK